MIFNWIRKKIIGSKNTREVRKLWPVAHEIIAKEQEYQSLTDEQLRAKTQEFKERIKNGETLDDEKVEAFAAVKNACRRLCGKKWLVCGIEQEWQMIPFDVQIIGGLCLHSGRIAEMATGEGKTLVSTFALYLNALSGENVQLVTVNEYLAQRDSEWVGKVFEFLGLTVGYIKSMISHEDKKAAYGKDITYGTASEFGFDYLRDNGMALSMEYRVQRSHFYCIIDEVDSILIDEARTPLIISGAVEHSTQNQNYDKLKGRVAELVKKQITLCAEFVANGEKKLQHDIEDQEGALYLYRVGIGAPKNKRFLKLMEETQYKRIYEKTHTLMSSDLRREENQAIKEDLYFVIDEKSNQVNLTEKGRDSLSYKDDPDEFVVLDYVLFYQQLQENAEFSDEEKKQKEEAFQKSYQDKMEKIHTLSQLLKAYSLFEKDVEYVVQDNKVMIVDEFTGRLQPGRRFSDGLHQALEAKEGVKIEKETQTLATITIQNYFRLYKKLAGMTGTAETEADEFYQIYKMEVLVIPTNKPTQRADANDVIYKTKREKYNAMIDDIEQKYKAGQPVLVGTVNVEISEVLSRLIARRKIPHNVLNAKQHQREAEIVAEAGQKGRVTIATNMAGRGTDIKLGEGVTELGGLHIIGSERHESRRIDRQLRGRAGRQGDPGSSVFYIALEDDLMRLFGSDRIVKVMEKLGMEEGQDLQSPLLNRAIERAQKKVEERNFSIRKHTLEFDDVMNKQRTVFYENRNRILATESLRDYVFEHVNAVVERGIAPFFDVEDEERDGKIQAWVKGKWPTLLLKDFEDRKLDETLEVIEQQMREFYDQKEVTFGAEQVRHWERFVCLDVIDRLWKDHLRNMDDLRESAYLVAYGQRDPLQEYKKGSFVIFSDFMDLVDEEITTEVFKFPLFQLQQQVEAVEHKKEAASKAAASSMQFMHEIIESYSGKNPAEIVTNAPEGESVPVPYVKPENEVGRNDPCPCGSGKKFKKCCGR